MGSFHLDYTIKDCNTSTTNFHMHLPRFGDRRMGRILFIRNDFTQDHSERGKGQMETFWMELSVGPGQLRTSNPGGWVRLDGAAGRTYGCEGCTLHSSALCRHAYHCF